MTKPNRTADGERVGSDELLGCTCTADARTHKQQMLDALHEADFWHGQLASNVLGLKKTKARHASYQQAIWWALEQLDDEYTNLSAT